MSDEAGRRTYSPGMASDTPTPLDATVFEGDTEIQGGRGSGPTSDSLTTIQPGTGSITAQSSRTIESAPVPTAQPASDPTGSTKLDPGFVHLVSGTLVGEYEVEKLLGAGGMGAVYRARHERLRKKVAIKVIAPYLSADRSAVERFEQEALALAQLSHPNIVAVLSIGTLPGDGRSYYVMEFLDGESLHHRLDRGRVPLADALDILDQIARGLDAAHAAGIVHRDLKPDNCWLQQLRGESRRIVKVLDFGLAKLVEHRRSEHTAVNVTFGTPNYMSPEQCQSARDVGPETDVYALGCIAYELLCGRLPFTYDNMAELVAAHTSEAPPRPLSLKPSIDPTLDALLIAMLAKDPIQRPTLARVRSVIMNARPSDTSATQPRRYDGRTLVSLTREARPESPSPAHARPASTIAVDEPRASRRVAVVLAGLAVLGGVIVAAVIGNSPGPTIEPKRAIELDASIVETAAPSVALDASVPVATPGLPIDASGVTPRPNADRVSPSIAAPLDAKPQEAEPTVVVEPPRPAAVEPSTVDASVESEDRDASEVDASVKPTTTRPSSDRTPPAPTAKRPNRDVIVNPFKKKRTPR